MLFSVTVVARPNGAATVKPAEIAARLRINCRREEPPSRSGPESAGGSILQSDLRCISLKIQSFEPRPKAMTNTDPANKRRIPAISTKIYWVKVWRTTRNGRLGILSFAFCVLRSIFAGLAFCINKSNSHSKLKLKTPNAKLRTRPCYAP